MANLKDTIVDGELRVKKDLFVNGRTSIKDAIYKIYSEDNKLILENFKGEQTKIEISPSYELIDDHLDVGEEGADTHTWSINRITEALRGEVILDHTHKMSQVEGLTEVIQTIQTEMFSDGTVENNQLHFTNKVGDIISTVDLSGLSSGSSSIRDDLETSTEYVWSISKVAENLSSKLGKDEAEQFVIDKVTEVAPPIIEEKLGEFGTILKGTEPPTNINLFWLDTNNAKS